MFFIHLGKKQMQPNLSTFKLVDCQVDWLEITWTLNNISLVKLGNHPNRAAVVAYMPCYLKIVDSNPAEC